MAKEKLAEKAQDKGPKMDPEKKKQLDLALDTIEKQFGKGTIMKLGDEAQIVPVISSGSITIDAALGVGGFPKGRVIEIYGPESSGKTTIALHAIAESQKAGGTAAFVDAEHAFDQNYAKRLGVDVKSLLFSQPESGESALTIVETLVRSGAVDIVVVDSVAALVPQAELEGEMSDAQVGLQARLMSKALRKLTGAISKSSCIVIFINQLREKIGSMGYGDPTTTTGGRALKFYSSVRIDVRRIGGIKEGTDVIGNRTKVKIVKNKVAPPFKEVEFDIIYGEGISKTGELIDLAVEAGIIKKAGAWFSFEGEKVGQGREAVRDKLKEDKVLFEKVYKLVKDNLLSITLDADDKSVDAEQETPPEE
ncbi:MAG: recombinase RecA [Chloroherpetonaceae bacterium]|nr:recombinase RecA [Chloroherpetonaceae bacterium]